MSTCVFIPHLATAPVTQHLLLASLSTRPTLHHPPLVDTQHCEVETSTPTSRVRTPGHLWCPPPDSEQTARCSLRRCTASYFLSAHTRFPRKRAKSKSKRPKQCTNPTKRGDAHTEEWKAGILRGLREGTPPETRATALTWLPLGFRNVRRDNGRRLQVPKAFTRPLSSGGPIPSLSQRGHL